MALQLITTSHHRPRIGCYSDSTGQCGSHGHVTVNGDLLETTDRHVVQSLRRFELAFEFFDRPAPIVHAFEPRNRRGVLDRSLVPGMRIDDRLCFGKQG